jgi:coenzyme F420-0:L-glutamate ligase/coenzyme F420-1:gamma-L-glutamate ligase
MSARQLVCTALPDFPLIRSGDDLSRTILEGLAHAGLELADDDVLVLASKIVSKAQGQSVRLDTIRPSEKANELARVTGKDARVMELVLRESSAILRARPGLVITRHRLGFVSANAGIDHSNVEPDGGEVVLLLPRDPDGTAAEVRRALESETSTRVAVIIADSHGRPHRLGTIGVAIGAAGLPALEDWRGRTDLFGYRLQYTDIGLADLLASAATLLLGQAREGTPVVHIRGATWHGQPGRAHDLVRPIDLDLFP